MVRSFITWWRALRSPKPREVQPVEIALAAMQGLLAAGVEPQVAPNVAWMVCVPEFYAGSSRSADQMRMINEMIAEARTPEGQASLAELNQRIADMRRQEVSDGEGDTQALAGGSLQ